MFKQLRRIVIIFGVFCIVSVGCFKQEKKAEKSQRKILEPISLQLQWVTQCQFAGYYVAYEKGWYKDEGIDLTIKPGGPDLIPVDLVAAGSSEFGTTLLADLSVAIQKGKAVVSIGQIQQRNGLLLVTKKTSGINHPKLMAGKKIGVWLGSWEAQFNALLAKVGLPEKNVKIFSQGWSMSPFLADRLDVASVMVYNEYQTILEAGIKPEELYIIDYADYGLAFPGDVLFTSSQLLKDKPTLALRMLRASLKGWQYSIDHPQEAVNIVLKYDESGIQTSKHQLAMMKELSKLVKLNDLPLGYTNLPAVAKMLDTLLKYNILEGPLRPEQIYDRKIYDLIRKETQK